MDKVAIDSTVWGYLKPVLVAAITRGLLWAAALASAHGIAVGNPTEATAATVLAGLMWVWGLVKSYTNHRLLDKAADPFDQTTLVQK